MGNRATCPVCGSYSSSILSDINKGDSCSICGCPNELLIEYQEILERKEKYENNSNVMVIIQENEKLIKENYLLKTKIQKIINILGYEFDSPIIDSFQAILKILHSKDLDKTE